MNILDGIKVVDLSRFISGPFCGELLGDMGADVIKVETPGGEYVRHVDPQYHNESLYYIAMNRNKRGITVNTRTEEGKEILRKLFKEADVLISNYKPGVMEKMGFSWEYLHAWNPKLIVVGISGFGQKGPMSSLPGFDSMLQAMGGLMSQTGPEGGEPYLAGGFVIDHGTALYATIGILGALYARQTTGVGQYIDCSLFNTALCLTIDAIPMQKMLGRHRTRMGNKDRNSAPVASCKTKDGKYVFIIAGPEEFWRSLCDAMGMPELKTDPRFPDGYARFERIDEVNQIVKDWALEHDSAYILELLTKAGVPAGPVLEMDEVLELPQVEACHLLEEVPVTEVGNIVTHGFGIDFSDTPMKIHKGAPRLGEHTEEILKMLGYTEGQIGELREKKAI